MFSVVPVCLADIFKFVHYIAHTVGKRVVRIRLKYLLVIHVNIFL